MDFNQYFRSRKGELIRLLRELVGLESPTSDKKAVDACMSFVVDELKKSGVKVQRFPQKDIGDQTLAEYPRAGLPSDAESILVLTHLDTVWPVGKIAKMPFYISGDKVFGPGVLDMKAGLVMVVGALKAFNELSVKLHKRVGVFINSAEETGHESSHEIIRNLAKKASYVLCLEPALPGGALKTQRKGRMSVKLEVRGKAAHAGSPEKGVNAIEEMMYQLRLLKKLQAGGVTASVNLVGGGEKANVVAEHAWATADIRFWNSVQKEKIIGDFRGLKPSRPGAKIKFSVESFTPPMEKTRASSQLLSRVREIAAGLGITLEEGKTGGGSDASIASGLGRPTLDGLGPDGDGIHAENEHLLLSSLVQRTALLTEILRQL